MHILIIPSERYVTKEEPLGGIFQYDQVHALKRRGIQVGVIAPMPRSLRLMKQGIKTWPKGVEVSDENGVRVYRYQGWGWIPGRVPFLSSQFYLKLGQQMFKRYVADRGFPDVVHAHNILPAGLIAAWVKGKYGIPFAVTEHSSAYLTNRIRKWQVPLIKHVLRMADARIVVSPYLGRAMQRRFGSLFCPWEWVPNILDKRFENQEIPKRRHTNKAGLFRILNIASLVGIKNHANLLKAFSMKFKGNSSVQLRIGGDGPLRERLEQLAKNLGIAEQVKFLGALTRQEVLTEMRECDLFVLSSNHETFGVVLIEALACGKPVVATACGGPNDIVHKGNGLLVPPHDVNALAEAMDEILHHLDQYNPMAIREDCIARFGEKRVVDHLISIYNRLLIKTPKEESDGKK